MVKRRNRYTKDMLEEAARSSYSIADVMRKLNVQPAGGTHAHIKRRLSQFGIDTSHFTGQRWNVGARKRDGHNKRAAAEILKLRDENSRIEPARHLRRALLEIGRVYKCEWCSVGGTWNDLPFTLEIDHINGQRFDNRAENLRFLCPNCHSQTSNYNRPKT